MLTFGTDIFATFFEVQLGRHVGDKSGKERTTKRKGRKSSPTWARFGSLRRRKSEIFALKMLCVYFQNCASCIGGEHYFIKFMKKHGREIKNRAERA